jgi:Protein of unknown function (DUF2530)
MSQREPPPPLEGDDRLITATVTAGWAVALVVVLLLTGLRVVPGRDDWWSWTCALGFGMGLFGLWYVPRLKRARARAEKRRAEERRADQGRAEEHGAEEPQSSGSPPGA